MSSSDYQRLLLELGTQLGVSEMQADSEGYLALTIDQIEVHFQYETVNESLILFTRLEAPEPDRVTEIYGLLLAANLFWQGTRGATFSVNLDTNQIYLAHPLTPQDLDVEKFSKIIEEFVNLALYWQSHLKNINEGAALWPESEGPLGEDGPVSRWIENSILA